MNWILKNKKKNSKTLLVVLFLAFGIYFFSNNAKAAEVQSACIASGQGTWDATNEKCTCKDPSKVPNAQGYCADKVVLDGSVGAYTSDYVTPIDPKTGSVVEGGIPAKGSTAEKEAYGNAYKVSDVCKAGMFECAISSILTGVQAVVGWLFGMAASLFAWVVEPENISGKNGMLNKQAVKDVWIMVRDLLNMTFILVLLFAAFCTIFQVNKWNLEKVWLNLLINALLVNFSFPIARFFIDISNVTFYYFVKNLFAPAGTAVSGSSIMAGFGAASNISSMLAPNGYGTNPIAYQVAIIVVLFIMGMTLLIVAALFVVRLVALTMLIMFSPIGFVGYIFPSTAKYADKWWSNLFSYSFFAPIMIFMMAIALKITEALKNENFQSLVAGASSNTTPDQTNFIANAAFFTIPIIILWMGMGIAKSMSIAGAAEVTSKVKGWGKTIANSPLGAGKYAWKQSGVPGGVKKGYENARKSGKIFGFENKFTKFALKDGREERELKTAGFMDDRVKGIAKAMEKKKAEEFRKKYKEKSDEHDRTDALGSGGLVDEILKADLHDPNKRDGDAMKVASMLHALKTDGGKKDEFELRLKEEIQRAHATHLTSLNDGDKDVFIKKEIAKNWKVLNDKGKQAHDVATKGQTTGPVRDHAFATAAGATKVWT